MAEGNTVLLWEGRTVVLAEFQGERRFAELQGLGSDAAEDRRTEGAAPAAADAAAGEGT